MNGNHPGKFDVETKLHSLAESKKWGDLKELWVY